MSTPEEQMRGVPAQQANSIPAPPTPKEYGDGSDVEQRAREMGWTPENEFKETHPNGEWRSAEDFVARDGHVNQPKEALVERSMKLDDMEQRMENMTNEMRRMSELSNKAYVKGIDEGMAKAKAAHAQAVEDGDHAAALDAANQMAALNADKQSVEQAGQPDIQAIQQRVTSMDSQVAMENPWLNTNPAANAYFWSIVKEQTQLDTQTGFPDPIRHQQTLQNAKNAVLQQMPELAGVNPNRGVAPPQAPGGRQPMGQQSQQGPTFEMLDSFQQQMCMNMVNGGAMGAVDTQENRSKAIQSYVDQLAASGSIQNWSQ